MADASDVGQGKTYEDFSDKCKAKEGEYQEAPVKSAPDDQRYPQGNLPQAPDPSPFKLGPMKPGE